MPEVKPRRDGLRVRAQSAEIANINAGSSAAADGRHHRRYPTPTGRTKSPPLRAVTTDAGEGREFVRGRVSLLHLHRVRAAAVAHEREHGHHRQGAVCPALCALGDVEPDEAQERDDGKDHRRGHLLGVLPSIPRYTIHATIGTVIPAAIANKDCVAYWVVTSSHVLSPTIARKLSLIHI